MKFLASAFCKSSSSWRSLFHKAPANSYECQQEIMCGTQQSLLSFIKPLYVCTT